MTDRKMIAGVLSCVCVCSLRVKVLGSSGKQPCDEGGMRSFMSNDQLMELKWLLSVSCLHTPSLKHTYTLKHPHTG